MTHRPPLSPHEVIVARVHDRIHALIHPSTTSSDQWLPDETGTRLVRQTHVVEHPSLIDQLRQGNSASTAGASGSGPGSKPPANITALSELEAITDEARRWARYAWGVETAAVEEALTVLDQRASTIEPLDDLKDLDWHVTGWWAHARIVTTWDSPPAKLHAPCPECGRVGGLRVALSDRAAVCLGCRASWDATTIADLGVQVQLMLEMPGSIEDIDPEHDAVAAVDDFDARLAELPSILRGTVFTA